MDGKKNWYIVDGWMPSQSYQQNSGYQGHESVMILNCQDQDADVFMDIYFEDRDPIENIKITVPAKRVKSLRVDNPSDMGGNLIERYVQYSLRIRSSIDVVVQYGRMDVAQNNLAYIGLMGYSE